MKAFKIYIRGFGVKQQLIWVGAILLIAGIVLAVIGFNGVYSLKQAIINMDPYLEAQQNINQVFIGCGITGILLGIIMMLAGGFSADNIEPKK
ncbi:MAG: hypothetical protein PHE59_03265 [Patescibacteria group bacterium]|nr:hypothetical protein [Patescibacteria group bacterium]MDD5164849.1 hypothetical protein [Patescibacteria group bacterium]MDD5534681.1 hypothetical protein [Patescibacteria group bacterium]